MKQLITLSTLSLLILSTSAQNFEWAKSMGGTGLDGGHSIVLDGAGNVYTIGYFQATVDFDPGPGTFNLISAGTNDIFISKLDASGNFVWAKSMGGTSADVGSSIVLDAFNNFYISGYFIGTVDFDPGPGTFNLTTAGDNNIFIAKFDSSGNFIWAKSMGGLGQDVAFTMALDDSGNVYTAGRFTETADFDPGPATFNLTSARGSTDIYVSKLDSSGSFLWARHMGGTEFDDGVSIALDAAGNVYITGRFTDTADFDPGPGTFNLVSAGNSDVFISKLDVSGNFVWAKSMGGIDNDFGYSITLDAAGNVYTTGYFHSTADFDPGSGVFNLTSAGISDIFISKLDSSGNFVWAKSMGGSTFDLGNSIALDLAGNIYTTGPFQGIADFDPGAGIYNQTSAGSSDIFIFKLDSSGSFIWAKSMGGIGDDWGRYIVLDSIGNLYTTGYFSSTVDFDPGPGIYNLTSAGLRDIFVYKMSVCTPPVLTTTYTNPPCPGGNGTATVNATGNAPFIYSWSNGDTTQSSSLSAGTYTVIVIDDSSCAAIATIVITEPAEIVSNISSNPTNFNSPNCNGSVSANPAGGTPPYTVLWNQSSNINLCEGWYKVNIADANGCVKTDSVYVNFVTGIEELNAAGISIYPNPVNDILTINSQKVIGEIKIYDVVGKLIYSELIKNKNAEFDVEEFDSGIYFIEIDGAVGKFVKE